MSFNRSKYEYFFPSKVYRCACIGHVIKNCRDHGIYSLVDIIDEVSTNNFIDGDKNKLFVVKCGEKSKDCIFVCERHLSIIIFAKRDFSCTETPSEVNITVHYSCGKEETYCTGCIRHYLKLMYNYFYFVDFDLRSS